MWALEALLADPTCKRPSCNGRSGVRPKSCPIPVNMERALAVLVLAIGSHMMEGKRAIRRLNALTLRPGRRRIRRRCIMTADRASVGERLREREGSSEREPIESRAARVPWHVLFGGKPSVDSIDSGPAPRRMSISTCGSDEWMLLRPRLDKKNRGHFWGGPCTCSYEDNHPRQAEGLNERRTPNQVVIDQTKASKQQPKCKLKNQTLYRHIKITLI